MVEDEGLIDSYDVVRELESPFYYFFFEVEIGSCPFVEVGIVGYQDDFVLLGFNEITNGAEKKVWSDNLDSAFKVIKDDD